MQQVRIIKHENILPEEILEVCNIKSSFGEYSIKSQKEWMNNHLKKADLHFLLYEKNELIAYLNLFKIKILINNSSIDALGVGNVCSKTSGFGYGMKLMCELRKFILSNNEIGYLFCKNNLVEFYKKYGWNIVKMDVAIGLQNNSIKSMLMNFKGKLETLDYNGRLF